MKTKITKCPVACLTAQPVCLKTRHRGRERERERDRKRDQERDSASHFNCLFIQNLLLSLGVVHRPWYWLWFYIDFVFGTKVAESLCGKAAPLSLSLSHTQITMAWSQTLSARDTVTLRHVGEQTERNPRSPSPTVSCRGSLQTTGGEHCRCRSDSVKHSFVVRYKQPQETRSIVSPPGVVACCLITTETNRLPAGPQKLPACRRCWTAGEKLWCL